MSYSLVNSLPSRVSVSFCSLPEWNVNYFSLVFFLPLFLSLSSFTSSLYSFFPSLPLTFSTFYPLFSPQLLFFALYFAYKRLMQLYCVTDSLILSVGTQAQPCQRRRPGHCRSPTATWVFTSRVLPASLVGPVARSMLALHVCPQCFSPCLQKLLSTSKSSGSGRRLSTCQPSLALQKQQTLASTWYLGKRGDLSRFHVWDDLIRREKSASHNC